MKHICLTTANIRSVVSNKMILRNGINFHASRIRPLNKQRKIIKSDGDEKVYNINAGKILKISKNVDFKLDSIDVRFHLDTIFLKNIPRTYFRENSPPLCYANV